jgi:RES domain-containing protein
MVYASESLALAALAVVAHLGAVSIPSPFVALEAEIPGEHIQTLDPATLPPGWESNLGHTRAAGSAWIEKAASAALVVPSVLPGVAASGGSNVLLNLAHPGFGQLAIITRRRLLMDDRLVLREPPP